MLSCPNCGQVLGEYPDAGVVVVACARCTFKYEMTGGTVTALTSRKVEVTPATERTAAVLARRFELAVATSSRETLRFTFDTDRDDDWIKIANGHRCAVVYSMRGDAREELLFVVDRTSGERFVLAKPGQRARSMAVAGGSLAAIVTASVVVASSVPFVAAAAIGIFVGVGATKLLRNSLTPKQALTVGERDVLAERQGLLGRKRELLRSREAVIGEIDARRALKQRLETLRGRMAGVQLDAYADRLASIDHALQTLDEQLELDARLVSEYDRAIQVLEIEYESSVAADALPDDTASIMAARLNELHEVEELRIEMTRRLAANAEVEKLLQSHRG